MFSDRHHFDNPVYASADYRHPHSVAAGPGGRCCGSGFSAAAAPMLPPPLNNRVVNRFSPPHAAAAAKNVNKSEASGRGEAEDEDDSSDERGNVHVYILYTPIMRLQLVSNHLLLHHYFIIR